MAWHGTARDCWPERRTTGATIRPQQRLRDALGGVSSRDISGFAAGWVSRPASRPRGPIVSAELRGAEPRARERRAPYIHARTIVSPWIRSSAMQGHDFSGPMKPRLAHWFQKREKRWAIHGHLGIVSPAPSNPASPDKGQGAGASEGQKVGEAVRKPPEQILGHCRQQTGPS